MTIAKQTKQSASKKYVDIQALGPEHFKVAQPTQYRNRKQKTNPKFKSVTTYS